MGPLALESPAFPSGDASYLSMGVLFHFPLIGSFSVFLSESPTSLYFCISDFYFGKNKNHPKPIDFSVFFWFEYYSKATVGASLPGM